MLAIGNGALRTLRAMARSPAASTLKQHLVRTTTCRTAGPPLHQLSKPHRGLQLRLCASGGGSGSGSVGGGAGGSGGGGGGSGGSSGSPGQPGGLAGLISMYMAALEANPLAVKSLTAAVLNALGDFISQIFVERNDRVDSSRTAKFAALGLLLVGPVMHNWYGLLSRIVPFSGAQGAVMRLALDQLVFAPIFISTFIAALMALDGAGSQAIKSKLQADLLTTVKVNWTLWVPAQYINFRYVPVNLQVLASNVTALVWNTYMSWASHKQVDAKHA